MTYWISSIFGVFSRRPRPNPEILNPISPEFRTRIIMWCNRIFTNGKCGRAEQLWNEMYERISFRLGCYELSDTNTRAPSEQVLHYLIECDDANFLDFVEEVFQVNCLFHVRTDQQEMVNQLNELFRLEDLPYFLTDYTTEEIASQLHGQSAQRIQIVSLPRVVCRGNEVVHSETIQPALHLLGKKHFKNANDEFLDGLQDYRKGDYRDCLTKCGSAFESVVKVICDRQGWPYQQTDTASTLVKTFLSNTQLDGYFESLLIIVATLRNRLSTSHGAGTGSKNVPQHIASFAISQTAAAILLVVNEVGES